MSAPPAPWSWIIYIIVIVFILVIAVMLLRFLFNAIAIGPIIEYEQIPMLLITSSIR